MDGSGPQGLRGGCRPLEVGAATDNEGKLRMNRKLKALGLALLAVFAMSAVAASGASAAQFHAEQEPVILTSDNDTAHVFTYGLGSVTCTTTTFDTTVATKTTSSITVTPVYGGCEFLEEPAEVKVNSCDYTFTADTTGEHAPVTVTCGAKPIEVVVPTLGNCTLTVGSQTTTNGVRYTNGGSGTTRDVTVDVTAKVAVTRDNPGNNFLCGLLSASGTGEYKGSTTLTGFADNGGTEGARIGIEWK